MCGGAQSRRPVVVAMREPGCSGTGAAARCALVYDFGQTSIGKQTMLGLQTSEVHVALHPLLPGKFRCVQFHVPILGGHATAFISEATWIARFGRVPRGVDFAGIVEQNRTLLDIAVTRRVAAGARQPVVLRATDL